MSENIGVLEKKPKIKNKGKRKNISNKKYKVIFHNDDETRADFVVLCLMDVFEKPLNEAIMITEYVHHKGKGVVGMYPMEEAKERVEKADKMKQQYNMPLLITVEEE